MTYTVPFAEIARPVGDIKSAFVPDPSADPYSLTLPARVVTRNCARALFASAHSATSSERDMLKGRRGRGEYAECAAAGDAHRGSLRR